MTITQIENNLNNLIENFTKENFIFDLLLAFGEPQATITRLQKGELNQLEIKGEVHHRKKVFFKVVNDEYSDFAYRFNIKVFPTTLIYDKDKNLKFSEVGYTSTFGLYLRMWWSNY